MLTLLLIILIVFCLVSRATWAAYDLIWVLVVILIIVLIFRLV